MGQLQSNSKQKASDKTDMARQSDQKVVCLYYSFNFFNATLRHPFVRLPEVNNLTWAWHKKKSYQNVSKKKSLNLTGQFVEFAWINFIIIHFRLNFDLSAKTFPGVSSTTTTTTLLFLFPPIFRSIKLLLFTNKICFWGLSQFKTTQSIYGSQQHWYWLVPW